jgi:hypothetical protein
MRLNIHFTRRTAYSEVREDDAVSILCTDREDGLQYFQDHYPKTQGYEIEQIDEEETC